MKNRLFYGDNLDILRRYVDDESVDLIYLDPPFKSNADYNILFKEKDGAKAASQLHAFSDTWEWNEEASRTYFEFVEGSSLKAAKALHALRTIIGDSDMLAYLSMMAPRLFELRRVLKQTGSLYLHCDSTAAHYLKLLLDAIFGAQNFRNEIVWKRRVGTSSSVHESNRFGTCTDTILFYAKSAEARFVPQYNRDTPEYQAYIEERFNLIDENGRRFQADNLANPAYRPNLIYEYKGYKPPANGWAISKEKMEQWDREGRIYFPESQNARLRRKRFADELRGMPIQNLWTDVAELNSQAQERLGYPTQKPVTLLDRIINASSIENGVVLDPFCGCGTAIEAAEKQRRRWIGIDITQAALVVIKQRLQRIGAHGYTVTGEPVSLPDAKALAQQDAYQFQWWSLGLVGARPSEQKKGADRGIDGRRVFRDGARGDEEKEIIFSVKSGKLQAGYVRELRGVVEREQAQIGVLISFDTPTKQMFAEAASAGMYRSPWGHTPYPRIQLLTIADLLSGKRVECPDPSAIDDKTFRKGPVRETGNKPKQERLFK
jgi:site-specific DNA-methyltransferase (adenine-specific)